MCVFFNVSLIHAAHGVRSLELRAQLHVLQPRQIRTEFSSKVIQGNAKKNAWYKKKNISWCWCSNKIKQEKKNDLLHRSSGGDGGSPLALAGNIFTNSSLIAIGGRRGGLYCTSPYRRCEYKPVSFFFFCFSYSRNLYIKTFCRVFFLRCRRCDMCSTGRPLTTLLFCVMERRVIKIIIALNN